jgi:hypothetical protein
VEREHEAEGGTLPLRIVEPNAATMGFHCHSAKSEPQSTSALCLSATHKFVK